MSEEKRVDKPGAVIEVVTLGPRFPIVLPTISQNTISMMNARRVTNAASRTDTDATTFIWYFGIIVKNDAETETALAACQILSLGSIKIKVKGILNNLPMG